MKFTAVLAVLAAAAASVSAAHETNANRMARGLPPLPPTRRATPVGLARRAGPSGVPTSGGGPSQSCTTGPIQCCQSMTSTSDPVAETLMGLLGIVVGDITAQIGLTCTPVGVAGGAGVDCNAQTVCCDNNNFNGLIAIGCTPININL